MFWNSAPTGLGTGTGIEVFEFDLACGPCSWYWKWLLCTVLQLASASHVSRSKPHVRLWPRCWRAAPGSHRAERSLHAKAIFPHSFGWWNATSTHGTFSLSKQFWHDVYYSAVMETDVEQWNFVFPKANLFNSVFQQDNGEEWNLFKSEFGFMSQIWTTGWLLIGYQESYGKCNKHLKSPFWMIRKV